MTLRSERNLALGAVRAEFRRREQSIKHVSPEEALKVLDDISRSEPELIASRWYLDASDNQIKLFKREWNKWRWSTFR